MDVIYIKKQFPYKNFKLDSLSALGSDERSLEKRELNCLKKYILSLIFNCSEEDVTLGEYNSFFIKDLCFISLGLTISSDLNYFTINNFYYKKFNNMKGFISVFRGEQELSYNLYRKLFKKYCLSNTYSGTNDIYIKPELSLELTPEISLLPVTFSVYARDNSVETLNSEYHCLLIVSNSKISKIGTSFKMTDPSLLYIKGTPLLGNAILMDSSHNLEFYKKYNSINIEKINWVENSVLAKTL